MRHACHRFAAEEVLQDLGEPRAADGEDRQREPGLLALFVLGDRVVQRSVVREARRQPARVRDDRIYVGVDGVRGDRVRGGGLLGELVAEEESLPASDQLVVEFGELIEAEVPEPLADCSWAEERRGRCDTGDYGVDDGEPADPLGVIGGEGVPGP